MKQALKLVGFFIVLPSLMAIWSVLYFIDWLRYRK